MGQWTVRFGTMDCPIRDNARCVYVISNRVPHCAVAFILTKHSRKERTLLYKALKYPVYLLISPIRKYLREGFTAIVSPHTPFVHISVVRVVFFQPIDDIRQHYSLSVAIFNRPFNIKKMIYHITKKYAPTFCDSWLPIAY